jgi:L-threonylcarbamoyladenylate synthase
MVIIKVDQKKPDIEIAKRAADIMTQGGIVVYPTDTAYGIGVNAYDSSAIKTLYDVKRRSYKKPTHVIVRDWKMLNSISYPTKMAKIIFDNLMPGPITIILQKKKVISDILTAGKNTIGIRYPNNKITKLLSTFVDFPYTTPSANISGGKTPYSIDEVKRSFDINKFDLVLDAGVLLKKPPSTILDLSRSTPRLIRKGPVKKGVMKK